MAFQVWKMFRRNLQSVQYGIFVIYVPRGRHDLLAQGHRGQSVNDIRRLQACVRVGFRHGSIGGGLGGLRDGASEAVEYTYDRNGNGEHVVGRNLEIGGGTNGMENARPGSSLMTVRPLYSFRSYYSL